MSKCYCRSSADAYAPRSRGVPVYFASPAASPYPRAVPDSSHLTPHQRRAAAAMLREPAAETFGLARLFAAQGYELALVGGTIRDVFLGRHSRDREFDLATDARPEG